MSDAEFKFENFVEYHGSVEDVKRFIDECPICGAKLMLTHLPDYKNLLVQESSRCLDCGGGKKKVIHVLN